MKPKIKPPEGATVYKIAGQDPIYADPEFRGLLDPLEPGELSKLEANIVADGRAHDPVAIWKETRIILDGHNRVAICSSRTLPYKVFFMSFPATPDGRSKAMEWMIEHQLGRRNLSAAGKAKAIEQRRQRVAEAHQKGESNRSIAGQVKASEATVRRDIAKTGAAADAPETIKGRDGKEHPRSRADRVGQKPVPTFVPRGERLAGDDTHQIKQDKEEARSAPRQGKPDFDWAAFNRDFANFMLNVSKLGKAHPGKHHQGPAATNLRNDLLAWKNRFREWGKAISNKEPTPDVVDKVRGRSKKGS